MKTPMQELHHWVSTELKLDGYEHGVILDKIESMLQKEKEVMVEFAYNCRNVMAADEFAITHWYKKTFNTKDK